MDSNDNDIVDDEPLAAEQSKSPRRRKPQPSVLEPRPRRREQIRKDSPRQRTELFLRENPVPIVLGALAIGLAVGIAIRLASREEKETEAPLGKVNWSFLSLPFLWPVLRSMKEKLEDSAEAVRESVGRVRKVDVDRYTKPIRKRWRSWTR